MNQSTSSVTALEEHKRRLTSLAERRTRTQGQLDAERRALEEAQREALELFGTSDLAELRRLYTERNAANDSAVVAFVLELDEVERGLAAVERQLTQ